MNAIKPFRKLHRQQTGHLFIMTLIFLAFGSVVIGPLMGYIGSGMRAGQTFETRTDELYAADAGIEDALWVIQNQGSDDFYREFVIEIQSTPVTVYTLPPYPPGEYDHDNNSETPPLLLEGSPITDVSYTLDDKVNGKTISVTIVFLTSSVYQIYSTATGSEGSTSMEVFTKDVTGDYSGITDQIITTPGEFDDSPNLTLNYIDPDSGPAEEWDGYWPDTPEKIDQFCEFFFWDVRTEDPYPINEIDLAGASFSRGPLFRDGNFSVTNTINDDPVPTLTLNGTLYIIGQTNIDPTKEMVIDLNGNTIFVECDLTGGGTSGTALWITTKCSLIGPGAIIAIGDIYFAPTIASGMTDPIFIMSASGTTTLQPGGNFYGAIAGEISVETQPGTSITYPEDGFGDTGINFPGIISGRFWGVETWNIN